MKNKIKNSLVYLGKSKSIYFQKGFTLIELLVVIAIISLLASVILVSINSSRTKARDVKRMADLNQMAKAFELYFNDVTAYPTGTGAVGTGYTTAGTGALLGSIVLQAFNPAATAVNLTPTYVIGIPAAPTPPDNTGATICTTANNPYFYETNARGTTYTITFCLGGATGGGSGLPAGVRYLTPAGFK